MSLRIDRLARVGLVAPWRAGAFACSLLVACAGTPPICRIGPESVPRGVAIDSIEFAIMERLLLAHDASGTHAENACDGRSTRFESVPSTCARTDEPGDPLPDVAPSADDLVLRPADGDYWLAFLPVRRFAGGVAEGPVAIVRIHEDALEVRALGVLRTNTLRINLTLERVGAQTILVADGETCAEGGSPCTRATRLLLLVGRTFEAVPVVNESGACLGPALYERSEVRVLRFGPRSEQTFRRSLGLDVVEGRVELAEQIVVEERDPSEPSRPARVVRRAESLVALTIDLPHERFVAVGEARWATMMHDAEARATGAP